MLRGLDDYLSPPDVEAYCDVCGFHVDHCICEECQTCGEIGSLVCYKEGHELTHPMKRIFSNYEGPRDMGRSIYKDVDCGPWIAFVTWEFVYDEQKNRECYREVYYEDALETWFEMGAVKSIKVGSIVEGSDVEIGPYEVDVRPVDTLMERFWSAVECVNTEACDEWEIANSEEETDNDEE